MDSGIYSVVVKFKGLLNYTPITKQAKVTIEPTVKGLDVVKMFRNNTQYYAISVSYTHLVGLIVTVMFLETASNLSEPL